ncbi:MAG: hypothetical protein WC222_04570 [Parachlamydiales bacterium]|jgi:hypothetical protein
MIVNALYNDTDKMPTGVFSEEVEHGLIPLIINKNYVVYGSTIRDGFIWYYICDEYYSYYPAWWPSPAFEVINSQLSRYWVYSCKEEVDYIPIIAFPEWAENPYDFYDRLTDGFNKEIEIFKRYKELMDLEFPDPSISLKAEVGDESWLLCPLCIDAWESTNKLDALVRCPKCQTIMNNPRYKIIPYAQLYKKPL